MILGLDGPVVIVSPRVAARLARPLRDLLRNAQRNGERVDAEVVETVHAVEMVARAYRTHQAETEAARSADGMSERSDDDESAIVAGMTTAQVAARLRCTTRNVGALAARGTLPHRRAGRILLFDPADVADLLAARGEQ